jgi:hypothetical protein
MEDADEGVLEMTVQGGSVQPLEMTVTVSEVATLPPVTSQSATKNDAEVPKQDATLSEVTVTSDSPPQDVPGSVGSVGEPSRPPSWRER